VLKAAENANEQDSSASYRGQVVISLLDIGALWLHYPGAYTPSFIKRVGLGEMAGLFAQPHRRNSADYREG
jgi:hypothetical protein